MLVTAAERVEGRVLTKRNASELARDRTQCREITKLRLARVREAALKDREQSFTALMHHLTPELLISSFYQLRKQAAKGIDGLTWQDYEGELENRINDLHRRMHGGIYKPKPARRVYIPKGDGSKRPLSIQCVEDKIAQLAVVTLLNQIYETNFKGFSYGFRPGRGQHDALDALTFGIVKRKVNWVLDLDIRQFFDTVEHEWLIQMLRHRVQDKRLIKLITRWIKVGIADEGGKRHPAHLGVPQGAVISPLLANIYLHYVFDLWSHQWRVKKAKGDVVIVRYADDAVLGFQSKWDANEYRALLVQRLAKFGLVLHADKTRLIRFGRFAAQQRAERGEGKPESFDFLGFTHFCTKRKNGEFQVGRKTSRKRLVKQIKAIQTELRRRLHNPPRQTLAWLVRVVRGHMNYYAVPGNVVRLSLFRTEVVKRWFKLLRRRSQRTSVNWNWFSPWVNRFIPKVHIVHAYPEERFIANHSK